MIPELGQFCLILAFVLSLWQMALPHLAAHHIEDARASLTPRIAVEVGVLITISFICLMISYARSDFTVLAVIVNSHSLKPLWYKITGTWGNHEGSMLLWVWVLAFFGLIAGHLHRRSTHRIHHDALSVLGLMNAGFLAFILLTSNPFTRVFPPAADGEDLNPLLQDIGLIIHPPLLYLGYVGTGIVFAYSAAAMLRRRVDSQFARLIHPWLLSTWACLSAGIAVGSWWAYRELGWGGWWYWDPVENVSLMPWLCATALMHCNLALEKRDQFARTTALLAMVTFSFSLIGTFIVRSGLITSVHAFASDPSRGLFMLGLIGSVITGGMILFARMSWPTLRSDFTPFSRTAQIGMAALILVTLAITILIAILYPLLLTLLKLPTISVGPPYFYTVFVPLVVPLALLAASAPLSGWDSLSPQQRRRILLFSLLPTLLSMVALFVFIHPEQVMSLIATSMAAGLILSMVRFVKQCGVRTLSLRNIGTLLGHSGFALLLIAASLNASFKTHVEAPMRIGDVLHAGNYRLILNDVTIGAKDNYLFRRAHLSLIRADGVTYVLAPETRFYPVRAQETAESAVLSTWRADLYAVIGRAEYKLSAEDSHLPKAKRAPVGVRLYIMPLQGLIWLSFGLIALSGFIATLGHLRRRHR